VPEPHRPVEIYVSASDGDDETGTGETNRPFATLQTALAKSMEGDVVKVGPGAYAGPVVPRGDWTRVESLEGPAVTRIDGGGTNRCFNASVYYDAVLIGFTLTNGYVRMTSRNEVPGAGASGGILENCWIRDCHAEGNYGCGGGAYYAILTNCTVENCSADWYGGGLYDCVATSCLILDCEALGYTDSYGGGASKSTLTHCTVYGCCSLTESGVDCDCACTDSIVWGNERITGETSNWDSYRDMWGTHSPTFAYSCTTPTGHYDGGGNIHEDPRFVSAATNDFRLLSSSPCVGSASDGVNMGYWQGAGVPGFLLRTDSVGPGFVTPEQAAVLAGGTATFVASDHHPFVRFETNGVFASAEPTFVWTNVCADGTLTAYFDNTDFYVDAATGDDASNGWTWASAKRTVTNAVDVAAEGETVWVNPGVYTGTVVCGSGPIAVRSTAGPDVTTIVGEADGPCFYGYYYPKSVVDGFTLQGGHFGGGGGIYYGLASNCVIANCTAERQGGGAYFATLVNCTVRGNRAGTLRSRNSTLAGGGVDCNCVCTNTLIWGNSGPTGAEDNWEAYVALDRWGRPTGTYVPIFYNCCTMPYNSQGAGNVFADPKLVTTNVCDARVYETSPCIGVGTGGANIGAYAGKGVVIPIPEVTADASSEMVSNVVATTGYADAAVAANVTNAAVYGDFRAWATNGFKTTAVVQSRRAFDSFTVRDLVAAPTLLVDGAQTRFELSAPEPGSDGACFVTVSLKDGANAVSLAPVKAAFARRTRLGTEPNALRAATSEDVRAAETSGDGKSVTLSVAVPSPDTGFLHFVAQP